MIRFKVIYVIRMMKLDALTDAEALAKMKFYGFEWKTNKKVVFDVVFVLMKPSRGWRKKMKLAVMLGVDDECFRQTNNSFRHETSSRKIYSVHVTSRPWWILCCFLFHQRTHQRGIVKCMTGPFNFHRRDALFAILCVFQVTIPSWAACDGVKRSTNEARENCEKVEENRNMNLLQLLGRSEEMMLAQFAIFLQFIKFAILILWSSV